MGFKTHNLQSLVKKGINVHEFKEISRLDELIAFSEKNEKFSIRFDKKTKSYNLPFYIYDNNICKNKAEYFKNIIEEMKQLNSTLLCSNGYIYDEFMKFNFVIELDNNYNFIMELSDKKVPLRTMYNYKTTIIMGNILDEYKTFKYINKSSNKYTQTDIMNILEWIISINFQYKYFEGTLYSKKVGMLSQNIVIWQTN